jgi:hypothetical protein
VTVDSEEHHQLHLSATTSSIFHNHHHRPASNSDHSSFASKININMKFSASTIALGLASLTSAISVSYDTGYDDGSRSLTALSCSDGANGLITKYGWNTQANVPSFPRIGGYQGVEGWNSAQCGTCYGVTYNGKTIYVLAVDHTANGFNLAKAAMDELTNGQAAQLGRIDAQYAQVATSN